MLFINFHHLLDYLLTYLQMQRRPKSQCIGLRIKPVLAGTFYQQSLKISVVFDVQCLLDVQPASSRRSLPFQRSPVRQWSPPPRTCTLTNQPMQHVRCKHENENWKVNKSKQISVLISYKYHNYINICMTNFKNFLY